MPKERHYANEMDRAITEDRRFAARVQLIVWPVMHAALIPLAFTVSRNADYVLLFVCACINAISSTIFLLVDLGRLAAWSWFGRKHFLTTGVTRIVPLHPMQQKKKLIGNFIFILSAEAGIALITLLVGGLWALRTVVLYVVPIIPLCIVYRRIGKAAAFYETAQAIPPSKAVPKKPFGERKHFFFFSIILFVLSIVMLLVEKQPAEVYILIQLCMISGICVIVPLLRKKTKNKDYIEFLENLPDD